MNLEAAIERYHLLQQRVRELLRLGELPAGLKFWLRSLLTGLNPIYRQTANDVEYTPVEDLTNEDQEFWW